MLEMLLVESSSEAENTIVDVQFNLKPLRMGLICKTNHKANQSLIYGIRKTIKRNNTPVDFHLEMVE